MTEHAVMPRHALPNVAARSRRHGLLLKYVTFPAAMLAMLWLSLNSGPWMLFRTPRGPLQTLHVFRTWFPIIVFPVVLIYMQSRARGRQQGELPGSLRLWAVYGVLGLLATLTMSPQPFYILYWAIAYLCSIAVIASFLKSGDPLENAVSANHVSWLLNGAFLMVLVLLARDTLFASSRSGYTTFGLGQSVAGMAMSRPAGMGRFAAVPGVIGFVFLFRKKGAWRYFWAGVFLASAYLVFYMQARGTMIAFAFALMIALLLIGRHGKAIFFFAVVLGIVSVLQESEISSRIWDWIARGSSWDHLQTMTGRTTTWRAAWPIIWESPLLGWGYQADRLLMERTPWFEPHVHNTYLYAMLTAGFIGAGFFIAGLARVWLEIYRLARAKVPQSMGHEAIFAQAGGILAFFTIRSIPEVSGAFFAVDLMVMLPTLLYIGVLYNEAIRGNGNRMVKSPQPIAVGRNNGLASRLPVHAATRRSNQ